MLAARGTASSMPPVTLGRLARVSKEFPARMTSSIKKASLTQLMATGATGVLGVPVPSTVDQAKERGQGLVQTHLPSLEGSHAKGLPMASKIVC